MLVHILYGLSLWRYVQRNTLGGGAQNYNSITESITIRSRYRKTYITSTSPLWSSLHWSPCLKGRERGHGSVDLQAQKDSYAARPSLYTHTLTHRPWRVPSRASHLPPVSRAPAPHLSFLLIQGNDRWSLWEAETDRLYECGSWASHLCHCLCQAGDWLAHCVCAQYWGSGMAGHSVINVCNLEAQTPQACTVSECVSLASMWMQVIVTKPDIFQIL